MKPNPKNFEPFKDPNGGEWIKIKNGKFKNTIWRPVDMKLENDDGFLTFTTEFLGDVPEDINSFEKLSGSIIRDIITETVNNENSDSNTSKT
jgi:hypothetical protein